MFHVKHKMILFRWIPFFSIFARYFTKLSSRSSTTLLKCGSQLGITTKKRLLTDIYPLLQSTKTMNDKCQCKLFLLPLDGSVCASNLSLFVGNSPFVSVHPHIQRHWHLHPPRATLSVVALLLVYRIITVGNCRKGRLHSPQLDFCWVAWVEVQLIPNRIHVLLQRGRGGWLNIFQEHPVNRNRHENLLPFRNVVELSCADAIGYCCRIMARNCCWCTHK